MFTRELQAKTHFTQIFTFGNLFSLTGGTSLQWTAKCGGRLGFIVGAKSRKSGLLSETFHLNLP